MGNNHGRISKDEKERRKNVSEKIIIQRKEQISNVQNEVLTSFQTNPSCSSEEAKRTIMATECAKSQLDRGGKPLNKKDLITILIALDPKNIPNIDKLDSMRMEDLNALIRCIIYDTQRFIPDPQNRIENNVLPVKPAKPVKQIEYQVQSSVQKQRVLALEDQKQNSLVLFQK